MKLIVAMIQPHKLEDVKKALFDANIHKMTVSTALGCGQQKGYKETYRGAISEITLLKKTRIEIAVNDEFVKPTIDAIIAAARTGNIGDGKIFVTSLEQCVRIRTGETGTSAVG
ncbi:MAG: transcriptional regulator [Spirochaetes bacterium GWF1_31_7]|nr:MAG: transcriptional regulator [Spirochaetes bacterium GWE1_32_154]OHD47166.1 MAG: transcriptional regulator [Spirochaetes bacterium GWF1_31_7]OHD47475.1 MAG: transcriptional regulator [Spirochaetes bacterium GWE2_31_10]HBD94961.1 transcriptional regulator [Spirochaetia bacterium]HBI36053.1 transcriptional regulator [Spirochaetia bacterium]